MYVPVRYFRALGLAALAALGLGPSGVLAQRAPVVPALNPGLAPAAAVPALGTAAVLGNGLIQSPFTGGGPFNFGLNYGPISTAGMLGTMASPLGLGSPLGYGSLAASYANSPLGYASLMNGYGGAGLIGTALSGAALGYGYGFGSGMYGTQWMMNPYQGYLSGTASLTNANAQYQLTISQAKLVREQAIQEHYRTRRAMMEQAEWEMAHRPDPEKIRQAAIERALDRARHDPPSTEIWSGRAPNALLRSLIARQGQGLRSKINPPLDEEMLKSINPTVGDTHGNVGLLKDIRDNGDLQWPQPLQGEAFKDAREDFKRHLKQAVSTAQLNRTPNDSTINDLQADLKKLHDALRERTGTMSENEQVEVNRYLRLLSSTITALKDRNVVNFLNDAWTLRGKNVAELVQFMRDKGLWFAPATPGNEGAYTALHHALVDFDAGLPRPPRSESSSNGSSSNSRGGSDHKDNNGAANP